VLIGAIMMKRLLIYSLFIFLSANWVGAQCIGTCTTVTATLTDNSTQAWSFATVTINLVKPFGYAGQMLNNGVPVNSPQNNIQADGTGTFTISLDDNVALTPAGSKWIFTFCPNATVANCSQLTQIVTGGSMNLSSIITNVLTIPIVNSTPTIYRAYSDTEALGGQGSLYWRTTDNTLRGCIIMPCPSNWIAIGTGGGGGSGTVNIGNLNFIPKYVTNPNGTVVGPDVNLDDGVTAANTLTYKGANGFNLPSDGVHSGSVQVGGNTTLPALANNAFGIIGPNSASFTSYFLQPDNIGPTNTNTTLTCTLPVGNVSQCTWGPPPSGSGCTLATTVNNGIVYVNGSGNCTSNADLTYTDSSKSQIQVGSTSGNPGLVTFNGGIFVQNIDAPQTGSGDSGWFSGAAPHAISIGTQSTGGNIGLSNSNGVAPQVITAISRSSNVVTVTFTESFNVIIAPNVKVIVAGVTDSSYNGTFKVITASKGSLTYNETGSNSSSSGGTIAFATDNALTVTNGSAGTTRPSLFLMGSGGMSAGSDGFYNPAISIVAGGTQYTSTSAGDILIMGGASADTGSDATEPAGNINIYGGTATGGNNSGGNINLTPGTASGTGTAGTVVSKTHINQVATGNWAGTCVFAASTTCSITYTTAGLAFVSTPVVFLQPVNPGAITFTLTSTSSTGFTITGSGSNSITVNWVAFGNPN
jgi:hypothetical protein